MQSTQISISDNLLLHVLVKPSNLNKRGPSYWNFNDKSLTHNNSLIRKDLEKNLFENESASIYKTLRVAFVTF